jgi:hypothetical protein
MKKINIFLTIIGIFLIALAIQVTVNSKDSSIDDASVTGFGINADTTVFTKVYEEFGSMPCLEFIQNHQIDYIFGDLNLSLVGGTENKMEDNSPLNCEYNLSNGLTAKVSISTYSDQDTIPESIDSHLASLAQLNISRPITQSIVGITDYIYGEGKEGKTCTLIIFHPLNDLRSVIINFKGESELNCEEFETNATKFTEVVSTKIVEEMERIYKLYLGNNTERLLEQYQMGEYIPSLSYYTGL